MVLEETPENVALKERAPQVQHRSKPVDLFDHARICQSGRGFFLWYRFLLRFGLGLTLGFWLLTDDPLAVDIVGSPT